MCQKHNPISYENWTNPTRGRGGGGGAVIVYLTALGNIKGQNINKQKDPTTQNIFLRNKIRFKNRL